MVSPAFGLPPSTPPVKLCSTVSLPLGSSLKTTPHASSLQLRWEPPKIVVPYRSPATSLANGPKSGPRPSVQPDAEQKLYSTFPSNLHPSRVTTQKRSHSHRRKHRCFRLLAWSRRGFPRRPKSRPTRGKPRHRRRSCVARSPCQPCRVRRPFPHHTIRHLKSCHRGFPQHPIPHREMAPPRP